MNATATTSDIIEGRNTRDNYNPADVRMIYRTSGREPQERLRQHFREEVEGGRFWAFLEEAHNLIGRSDLKRLEHAEAHFCQWLLEWVATYGLLEDLSTFPRITDISRDEG
jgi:hypothetical protein